MKKLFFSIIYWKNKALVDLFFSIVEVLFVLLISHMYLVALTLSYALETVGASFASAFRHAFILIYDPIGIITYGTGVLSSTIAYFIIRLAVLKTHIKSILFIVLFTFILFLLTTPLFISGHQSTHVNQAFALEFAKLASLGALGIWLYSLFSQRRIFDRRIILDGDRRGKEIAEIVGGS